MGKNKHKWTKFSENACGETTLNGNQLSNSEGITITSPVSQISTVHKPLSWDSNKIIEECVKHKTNSGKSWELIIPAPILQQMNAMIHICPVELSALFTVKEISNTVFEIEKLFIPKQVNTDVTTEIFPEELAQLLLTISDEDCAKLTGWFHSHHTMPVQWSSTDYATMGKLNFGKKLICLVGNRKGQYNCSITLKEFNYVIETVSIKVKHTVSPELEALMRTNILIKTSSYTTNLYPNTTPTARPLSNPLISDYLLDEDLSPQDLAQIEALRNTALNTTQVHKTTTDVSDDWEITDLEALGLHRATFASMEEVNVEFEENSIAYDRDLGTITAWSNFYSTYVDLTGMVVTQKAFEELLEETKIPKDILLPLIHVV